MVQSLLEFEGMVNTHVDMLVTLENSAKATGAVARGVRPDQFDSPTPCAEWNVQELMNHLIGSLEYFKARGDGKDPGRPEPAAPGSYAATVGRLDSAALAMAAAWRQPGALDKAVTFGTGEIPGSVMATLALSEMLTHGWDLARATGQQLSVDDVDIDAVLATMKQTLKPEARQPGFGPEIPAPDGAPPIDRLAAFLGRQP
jgi:uncharacterized protein (TIGR03086 family)